MYCSIDDAWNTNSSDTLKAIKHNVKQTVNKTNNKKTYEHFVQESEHNDSEHNDSEHIINARHSHHPANNHNKCDDFLEHLNHCDVCMKKVYRQFNCIGKMPTFDLISIFGSDDNRRIASTILLGLLIILVLHLFSNNDNK